MPKSSRKKREKVADFSRAKLKLGKGKKLPSNVVDTSFKSRSIALPTQSITVDKDNTIPTNKRRQTLNDILSLFKHYNAGTRKDAISSAKELFHGHPGLLQRSIAPLLNACGRLIGDEDASVRKTLLSFIDWVLSRVDKKDLIPHVQLLLLFTASAQTHIFPEIQIDAVRFLNLLLDTVPESVVRGWNASGPSHGKRTLEGYFGILNAGTKFGGAEGMAQATFTTAVVLSPQVAAFAQPVSYLLSSNFCQSKLVVLQSLSRFLDHAVSQESLPSSGSDREAAQAMISAPTWFLRPSFASTRLYEEFESAFQSFQRVNSRHLNWNTDPDFESFDEDFAYDPHLLDREATIAWNLNDLADLSPEMGDVSRPLDDISLIVRLSRTLYPTLTATFIDCAAVVFSLSVNAAEIEVQMLMAAVRITRALYGAILQSPGVGSDLLAPYEELKMLLDYLAGYFPFAPARREAKMEQAFQDLSVIYCELTSLLVLASQHSATMNPHRRNGSQAPRHTPLCQVSFSSLADRVKSYVIQLLRGGGGSDAQLPRPISAIVYTALLPTIWALLNQRNGQRSGKECSSVLEATLDHAMETTSGSAVKRLTIEFVGRLLLLEKEKGYIGNFSPRDEGLHMFRRWILDLPKTLWEAGANNLVTTQTVLGVLLRLVQCGSCVMQREQISLLSSRLRPFFMIIHPMRGQVLGPFSKIPSPASHVRCLALDLCAVLLTDQTRYGERDDSLCHAVSEAVKGTREELYWAGVTEAMRAA